MSAAACCSGCRGSQSHHGQTLRHQVDASGGKQRDYELLWSLITPDADVAGLWHVILQIGKKCSTNTPSHLRTGRKEPDQRIKVGDWLLQLELEPVGSELWSSSGKESNLAQMLRLKATIKNSISSAQESLWSRAHLLKQTIQIKHNIPIR